MAEVSVQGSAASSPAPRYQPLVLVAVAVCAGIVADRYWARPVGVWWALGVVALGAWWLVWRRAWDRAASVAVLLSAAACGGAWHHCRWNLFEQDDVGFYARQRDRPICLEAVATSGTRQMPAPPFDPMRIIPRGESTRVEVAVVALRNRSAWQAASGRARLIVDGHLLGVRAGDRLRVFARLQGLRPPHNPGEFDFAAHHRADRTQGVLRADVPECVSVVRAASVLNWRRWIDALRAGGDRLLWSHLDPRRAALASAVLLGCREEVSAEQTEAFMQTGTVHVLSISGMHVGILAALVFLVMRLLPVSRGAAAAGVGAVVVAYTLLADAEPPAVRAMVLVLVMCDAYRRGRRAFAMNSLAFAALVVLALNPADLFRVGVQLSFLCMMAIAWFPALRSTPDPTRAAIRRVLYESRNWPVRVLWSARDWAWELTLMGAVIWAVTLPLVMARFHIFSPVAVGLNTVLWLPMTAALWSGLGALALGAAIPAAAAASAWCCDRTLAGLQWGVEAARSLPGSYFWVPGPADWWLVGFYGGLGLLLAFPRLRPPRRWCAALLAGWIGLGFGVPMIPRQGPQLKCTFLSVGQGCAAVLRLPSGGTMLYDAGAMASPETAAHAVASYLWSEGITHLDAIVLSHADADHYNGVPGVLERFSVGVVYVSAVMFEDRNAALDALEEAIRRARVPVRTVSGGDQFAGGEGCRMEVLHPPRRGVLGSDNANSIVLAIEYYGRRILLVGDLEPPGLNELLEEEPWPCDVLLARHHGGGPVGALRDADPSSRIEWEWCSPRFVVVSGRIEYNLRRTMPEPVRRVASIVYTGDIGSVSVILGKMGGFVQTFRGPVGGVRAKGAAADADSEGLD